MSVKPRPEDVKKLKPEERLPVLPPPPDERRWWELQLGVTLLDRLYTEKRSGR